ncbi:MAG: 2-oxoglutarate dehydrogenase E1 component [Kiritimatiellae bacterium]|nr:2-oxoglutarate dehydrogenase E1 component [Kiritimatiellia bacterium]
MSKLEETVNSSYLYAGSAPFIEGLYEQYLSDPYSVAPEWKHEFDRFKTDVSAPPVTFHSEIRRTLIEHAKRPFRPSRGPERGSQTGTSEKQAAVLQLIQSCRLMGHLKADLDPIALREKTLPPDLDPFLGGLTEADLDTLFATETLAGPKEASLREILEILSQSYESHIGTEYMHIHDSSQKQWIQERLETTRAQPHFNAGEKRQLLERLTAAEGLERYLHTKYAGQKRFSLEGGESLIPLLSTLIDHGGSRVVKEVVIGMAHRGRLNVLVNIMGKLPRELFLDFEGKNADELNDVNTGDVKYHQGFSADIETSHGYMHLALAFNPSHLEIIDPVVEGSVRARQDRRHDDERSKVMAVLIHGDASIAGQGVVYETFSLAQTRGFTTGGTIHIVVNNRIGFTTSDPSDARSTFYCTDIGKVVQAPIFHVNGDDPEAVAYVAQMALDFRMTFKRDVIIDLVCYREHGHNEADEPVATQPVMYKKIRQHPGVQKLYANQLIKEKVLTEKQVDKTVEDYRAALDSGQRVNKFKKSKRRYPYIVDWRRYLEGKWADQAVTVVSASDLKQLGDRITSIPEDFELHPRVSKVLQDRKKMTAGALPVDWGCAEMLAYASLIKEGYPVRLSGQDSGRGTFFHRHAVLHNQRNGERYVPLQYLYDDQPRFKIIDSILSEEAVLGFEYGYSFTDPKTLSIWEAQYGDFANVAQVVIDQFISSSEAKWGRLCGLTLLLPHGWEGQGPEHSSARLERFMQLCATENIQVCMPTSPAQHFHLLRRQMLRPYRKPLVIMSPKSMLRRKLSFSSLEDLTVGGFHTVLGEVDALDAKEVERIILCSGKVYYELLEARRKNQQKDVAIVRVEQLYPFPSDALTSELRCYPNAHEIVWTQEEPMNQGAWYSIQHHIRARIRSDQSLSYAGRLSSAAPAGGSHNKHIERQQRLVKAALNTKWTAPCPVIVYQPQRTTTLQVSK